MEKLPVVKEKGLAVTFEKLRNDRNISAHLIQDVRKELPNTLAWKKKVFAQVLHTAKDQLLVKKQLTLRGVSSDVIETVLFVLEEDLKGTVVQTPDISAVTEVNDYFTNTLRSVLKDSVEEL